MIIINVSSVKLGRSGGSETLATNFILNLRGSYSEYLFVGEKKYLTSLHLPQACREDVLIKNHVLRRIYTEYMLLPLKFLLIRPKKIINFSNTCSPVIPKKVNLLVLLDANYRHHEGMNYLKKYFLKKYIGFVSKRADKIVTISESAAKDLAQEVKGKISVAYLGGSFENGKNSLSSTMIKVKKPFALALCSLSTNKNIEWLVTNWSSDLPTLVLTGHGSEKFTGLNDVLGLGYVSMTELKYLFSRCEIFVFPSLYEGFGIPIVDCMQMKKPLVMSDIKVFREVAGEYGSFFELGSRESLHNAVNYELSRNDKRQAPRQYSWQIFTEKILAYTE